LGGRLIFFVFCWNTFVLQELKPRLQTHGDVNKNGGPTLA
jgi:hypothetical protein